MKTLGRLKISPEKMLIDDELKSLKGGWCGYMYVDCPGIGAWSGPACGDSEEAAEQECLDMWGEFCTCEAY